MQPNRALFECQTRKPRQAQGGKGKRSGADARLELRQLLTDQGMSACLPAYLLIKGREHLNWAR